MAEQLRLSQLCSIINNALVAAFREKSYWVLAEIKERNDKANKIFFELVEKASNGTEIIARINGSVWRKEALAAFRNFEDITGKRPDRGMQVLIKVEISYHQIYGLTLQLSDIDSQHMLGQLELQRRNTIQLLATKPGIKLIDGVFQTPNKILKLNPVIQHIAFITSASAAGYQDFLHTLQKNMFGYTFNCTPYFSILQGEKAAEQMKDQLLKIFEDTKSGKHFDAVVIIRGGGAQSDLLPFDEFNLAHTVARFPIPVITGVGHLRNESIVDMVANVFTIGPTHAANFIIAQNRSFEEQVMGLRELITLRANNLLTKQQRKIDHIGAILTNGTIQLLHTYKNQLNRFFEKIASNTKNNFTSETQKLNEKQKNLSLFTDRIFDRNRHQLAIFTERVKNLHPNNVLKRGYAMLIKKEQLIVSTTQIKIGDAITIKLKDGAIETTVAAVQHEENK
ncbi:MAG: exodeoxyribonuclease VII large subunit [Bacteroidetes bacterium]|nr:exodeoxyribonuclease VII large subunit [Bacteroidota bacterium]PHX82449.1 MAG: exodeoxyribonuclease VII large subunit [Flavobacteriales bacterium]